VVSLPRPKPGTRLSPLARFIRSEFHSGGVNKDAAACDSKCSRFVYDGEYEVIVSGHSETRLGGCYARETLSSSKGEVIQFGLNSRPVTPLSFIWPRRMARGPIQVRITNSQRYLTPSMRLSLALASSCSMGRASGRACSRCGRLSPMRSCIVTKYVRPVAVLHSSNTTTLPMWPVTSDPPNRCFVVRCSTFCKAKRRLTEPSKRAA
jgi:hypothetical protein